MNTQKNDAVTIEDLQVKCAELEQEKAELKAKLNWFEEQFRLNRHRQFGTSSEKTDYDQPQLFNEIESEAKPAKIEPTLEEITYTRRKQAGHREEQLKDLPVETIEYRLPPEEQVCSCCGNALHEMSTEVRQELKFTPAQMTRVCHVRYVYGCRSCEQQETTTPIVTAPMPAPVLPGSLVSPSLMASVMTQKYLDGMPLYRQEQAWSRLGVELSRQTMANWMIQGSSRYLEDLYNRMHEHLLKLDIAHADETTVQVLKEDGREAEAKSYMWLYRSGRDGPPIVLFDYQTTRANKHPSRFLKGFKGYLHVDGYPGYHGLEGVILVGCLAHARRRFTDALKAMPKTAQGTVLSTAQEGLDFCNQLYAIESALKELSPDKRYEERQKRSVPVLEAFSAWLKMQTPRVLPKSALGEAIRYCRNQWDKLIAYLKDGRLEIDNNRAERSIKPFVMGRKAWLFSQTPRGAKASAVIYSIIETAKENGLNPFQYLTYLFEKLPNVYITDSSVLDNYLPWSSGLPDHCRMPRN
jgi:transposase